MTHLENYNLSTSTIEEMSLNGLEAIPELVRVIPNSVMQAEPSKYLQANAYERTEERKGHANGYKPKTVRTPSLARLSLPFHKYKKAVSIPQRWKKA